MRNLGKLWFKFRMWVAFSATEREYLYGAAKVVMFLQGMQKQGLQLAAVDIKPPDGQVSKLVN